MSDVKLKCIYGNTVTLENVRTKQTETFELVHYNVEKLDENKISNYTPIGRAIWAKEEGAEVSLALPGQTHDLWKIAKIENT